MSLPLRPSVPPRPDLSAADTQMALLLRLLPRKTLQHGDLHALQVTWGENAQLQGLEVWFRTRADQALSAALIVTDGMSLAGYRTADALWSEPRHVLVHKLLLADRQMPSSWNRHDFLAKMLLQRIGDSELGRGRTRAVLQNESGRSDMLVILTRSSSRPDPPVAQLEAWECENLVVITETIAEAATRTTVELLHDHEPSDFPFVGVLELKYSHATKHGRHWRHNIQLGKGNNGPSLLHPHFLIVVLDSRQTKKTTQAYSVPDILLNDMTDLTFLLSCSAIGFPHSLSLSIGGEGLMPDEQLLLRNGFVGFKTKVDKATGALTLVNAFDSTRRFHLRGGQTGSAALTAALRLALRHIHRPSFLTPFWLERTPKACTRRHP